MRVDPVARLFSTALAAQTHGIIALAFRCHVVNGTPRPTAEASEAAWLTPDEVRDRTSPAFAVRLLDAIEDQARGPAVRTHDGKDLLADAGTRS